MKIIVAEQLETGYHFKILVNQSAEMPIIEEITYGLDMPIEQVLQELKGLLIAKYGNKVVDSNINNLNGTEIDIDDPKD